MTRKEHPFIKGYAVLDNSLGVRKRDKRIVRRTMKNTILCRLKDSFEGEYIKEHIKELIGRPDLYNLLNPFLIRKPVRTKIDIELSFKRRSSGGGSYNSNMNPKWEEGESGNPKGRPKGCKDIYYSHKRKSRDYSYLKKYQFKQSEVSNPKGTPDWKDKQQQKRFSNFHLYLKEKFDARGRASRSYNYQAGIFATRSMLIPFDEYCTYELDLSYMKSNRSIKQARHTDSSKQKSLSSLSQEVISFYLIRAIIEDNRQSSTTQVIQTSRCFGLLKTVNGSAFKEVKLLSQKVLKDRGALKKEKIPLQARRKMLS